MDIPLEMIQALSMREQKTLLQRFAKLAEEMGELAQEILIEQNASGFQYKKHGDDGVLGETVDVLLVGLSIYFKSGGEPSKLAEMIEHKCEKWRKWQAVSPDEETSLVAPLPSV